MPQREAKDDADKAVAEDAGAASHHSPRADLLRAKPRGSNTPIDLGQPGHIVGDGTPTEIGSAELGPRTIDQQLPRAAAALRDAGFAESERRDKLLRATKAGLSEDEIVALAEPLPLKVVSPTRAQIRQQWLNFRYELIRWWRYRSLTERILYAVGWVSALVGPTLKFGFSWLGGIGIAVVAVIKVRSTLNELNPKHMPILRHNHRQRQLRLEKLVHSLLLWKATPPTKREVSGFQQETLGLIASYMRDHRSDTKGKTIFANLLVRRDGDRIVVVARSDEQRPIPQVYRAEECSVCWSVLETGGGKFTGDVYADHPNTCNGKRYHSIIALPVKLDHRTIGVVSIDSEARHHFDRYFAELETELAPFVQLLAATLA